MADWGKGATSKKKEQTWPPKYRTKFFICAKCGKTVHFQYLYDSDLKQVQDDFGNMLCKDCRAKMPKRSATPPPEYVQVRIDEVLNAKK